MFVFALFFVSLVGCNQYIVKESKVLDFMVGFLEGIESDIGDLDKCLNESVITFKDFEEAIEDFEYGFKHLSKKHFEKGLLELAGGLMEILLAIKDCGAIELGEDIAKLIEAISEGTTGIIKILVHEAISIFSHGVDLTKDFAGMIKSWKEDDFKMAGLYLGKIVGILIEGL